MGKSWLYNKTVLITGASGGIGFSVAKLLIEKYDCKIIGIARNESKMLKAIETLGEKKKNFSYHLFDVSVKENWQKFYNYLTDNKIMIDLLFNNAGFMLPFAKFEKYSESEINEIIKTNFIANLTSINTLLPIIKQSKTPAIVNVCSAAGLCAVVGQSMYCATKFAMRGFTETLQQEYKRQIYIGGVYPGFIRTDILNRQSDDAKNNKLINKLMMPLDKATKKIVKGISKKKKRIVMGFDGCSMSFFGRLFPKMTPNIITGVLKSSKLEMFNEVFNYDEEIK
ncbi:MAG: SDR family NAD(P)-dependent oxidoreductase [Clostridia bacterium]|nr:SDR family NAD(P)-dependent oxidoreductase [Clostridia bacterium]